MRNRFFRLGLRQSYLPLKSLKWRVILQELNRCQVAIAQNWVGCSTVESKDALSYQFRYRDIEDSAWVSLPVGDSQKVLADGLGHGNTYEFQCRLKCNEGELSNWSESVYFRTQTLTASYDQYDLEWEIYPNPAFDFVEIILSPTSGEATVSLFDALGRRSAHQVFAPRWFHTHEIFN